MMAFTDMIISMKMSLADIMKKTYDADTILGESRFQFLKLLIHAKRMDSQSSQEFMMGIAPCSEEIAILQVPYHPIHPWTIDLL
jgi:hypothetical protein